VQVPVELVAEAVATWAKHQGDYHTACTALMAAQQWHDAHEVLCMHVAPSLMLSKGWVQGSSVFFGWSKTLLCVFAYVHMCVRMCMSV